MLVRQLGGLHSLHINVLISYTLRGNCGELQFIPKLILSKVTFNLIVSLLYLLSEELLGRNSSGSGSRKSKLWSEGFVALTT
jgi:hypothetical protein